MVRRRLLLRVAAPPLLGLLVTLLGVAPAAAADEVCSGGGIRRGDCNVSGSLGDGQATLEGSGTQPGSGAGSGTAPPAGGGGFFAVPPADPACVPVYNDRCLGLGPGRAEEVPPGAVTMSDIASFRPAPGAQSMEPNGWMIVGLDANFYATVLQQVVEGTLLGQPAAVRFTPVAYDWAYGDGTSARRFTPGSTWSAQGIREFDPTPTSHVYTAPGTYTINLTIHFAAEYHFAAGPWTRIAGTLPLPANPLTAAAGDAKTVLVERECTRNPSGPGC